MTEEKKTERPIMITTREMKEQYREQVGDEEAGYPQSIRRDDD